MTPPTLAERLDDAALYSLDHQLHLDDVVGQHTWSADLVEPSVTLDGNVRLVCNRFHLLGSAAPGPQSFLWSWANPQGYAPEILAMAQWLRDQADELALPLLATSEIRFDQFDTDDPQRVASIVTDLAKVLTGRWTSYTPEVGGGTRMALLIEHDVPMPEHQPERVMRVLTQGLQELPLTDQRRAIASYLYHRDIAVAWADDGRALQANGGGLSARVTFDDLGRATNLEGSLGGQPEPS